MPDGEYRWRMRSVNLDTGAVSAWSGWCGFTVDAARDVEPAPEDSEAVECPVPVGAAEPLEAADESVALALAQACDAQVEVTSQRDFDVRVVAQAEISFAA